MLPRPIRRLLNGLVAFRRSFEPGFDTSGGSGRWPSSAALFAPVSQLHAAAPLARRRIAYICENSPLAASVVQTFTTSAVGDGAVARANVEDPDEGKLIEQAFDEFCADCDIE